jgi:hypothetical protein
MSDAELRTLTSGFIDGRFRKGYVNDDLPARFDDTLPRRTTISNEAVHAMSVDVSVVARTASAIVMMFCLLSLIFGSLSYFQMVHPFVAVILIIASGWFYAMGILIQRKSKMHDRDH